MQQKYPSSQQQYQQIAVPDQVGQLQPGITTIDGHLNASRIESIDLLRGIVMIIMAIDHVRDYFLVDAYAFSPTDVQQTTAGLFFTRWITHLCAPTFIFLAGCSAYFIRQRKTVKETSFFLFTRGLWLFVLQMTIIRFMWNFDPLFHYNSQTIISIIGLCMMILAVLVYLPFRAILIIGLVMVFGHNAFDGITFVSGTAAEVIWSFLHTPKNFDLGNGYIFNVIYPLIPWVGVMALGYCMGSLYSADYSPELRKKILLILGNASILLFIVLRWTNLYGDLHPWSEQTDVTHTLLSFLNVEKYPPSLLYLAVTLGISLLLLALMEGKDLSRWKPVTLFGKVALFYYVLHVLVIHLMAMVVAVMTGYPWQSMILTGSVSKRPSEFGYNLGGMYVVWAAIVLLLYPLCVYWNALKIRNKKAWWVSYV